MDYSELYEKYEKLLAEVNRLSEENNELKAQLGRTRPKFSQDIAQAITSESNYGDNIADVNNTSDYLTKIRLFMSLFKGRDDVFAKLVVFLSGGWSQAFS